MDLLLFLLPHNCDFFITCRKWFGATDSKVNQFNPIQMSLKYNHEMYRFQIRKPDFYYLPYRIQSIFSAVPSSFSRSTMTTRTKKGKKQNKNRGDILITRAAWPQMKSLSIKKDPRGRDIKDNDVPARLVLRRW